ncbi:probable glutathione S-transferase [Papaver somniferum]|nr:probable glutathione S-transferase [Papaver somniferum]
MTSSLNGAFFKVKCGLELKGIKYEYIKEDLMNKSEMLLKYNPVYKKIPVFVHGEKPILESMVIREYIEETWPNDYPLLPKDPYEKSIARFWIKFSDEKGMIFRTFFKTPSGEEHEKTKGDIMEILKTIEEQSAIGNDNKFFGGDKINAVDLAFAFVAHWFEPMEEVAGVKLLEAHKFPKLHAWTERFKQNSVVKNNLPDTNELVGFFKGVKEYGYLTPPPPPQ